MFTFTVQDMTCGGCASSIRNAVGKVPGVQQVQADPATHLVVVSAAAEVTPEAIVSAMNGAGYREITAVDATA